MKIVAGSELCVLLSLSEGNDCAAARVSSRRSGLQVGEIGTDSSVANCRAAQKKAHRWSTETSSSFKESKNTASGTRAGPLLWKL